MKRIPLIAFFVCAGLFFAGWMLVTATAGPHPDHHMSAQDFVGVWNLVHMEGPERVFTEQHGVMMVYANYVCHMQAQDDRVAPMKEDTAEVKAEKRAKLWGQTTAACGTFEMKEDTVSVNWTTSSDPAKEGHLTDFVLSRDGERIKLALVRVPDFKFVYEKVK